MRKLLRRLYSHTLQLVYRGVNSHYVFKRVIYRFTVENAPEHLCKRSKVQAANLAAADLKRRKNELENKYREISAAIKRSQALNADITAQEQIYSRLKTVYDKVMTYKKDPAMLCIITNGVNFTSLAKMFRGVFDSETVDNALKDTFCAAKPRLSHGNPAASPFPPKVYPKLRSEPQARGFPFPGCGF